MTFSIVAFDPATGQLGGAVASKFLGVGGLVLSGRAEYPAGNTWTEALVASPPDGPIDAAGAMAHLYYQAGKWNLANQWVALANPADLSAQWVRAKLLLREGKLAEAESILASVTTALVMSLAGG